LRKFFSKSFAGFVTVDFTNINFTNIDLTNIDLTKSNCWLIEAVEHSCQIGVEEYNIGVT